MFDSENKKRILVVEDEAAILQVLCVYLQYAGFEVLGVGNGEQAIQIIPEFRPQLIVLDVMMQPVSGWDVLDWLRAKHITPPLPVLVMTALTNLKDQVHGYEEGAVEYMTKPTQPSLLVEHIHNILALSIEQRATLRHTQLDEKRRELDRLNAPQPDEFIF